MGFRTKVQLIKRKTSEQWYINFPSAVAQAMEFARGEIVEWFIDDKETLVLSRPEAPPHRAKKNAAGCSSGNSTGSGEKPAGPSNRSGRG